MRAPTHLQPVQHTGAEVIADIALAYLSRASLCALPGYRRSQISLSLSRERAAHLLAHVAAPRLPEVARDRCHPEREEPKGGPYFAFVSPIRLSLEIESLATHVRPFGTFLGFKGLDCLRDGRR